MAFTLDNDEEVINVHTTKALGAGKADADYFEGVEANDFRSAIHLLRSRVRGWVNAAERGVGADKTASYNSGALQEAIHSQGSSGDRMLCVLLPSGVINLDATISIPEGVELRGQGAWKSKLDWGAYGGAGLQFVSGGTYDYPPMIRDLAIHAGNVAIDTGSLSGAHIEDVWINAGRAIQVPGTADLIFRGIVFDGGTEGIVMTSATEMNNILIAACHFTGVAYPITVQNVRDCRIVGNAFRGDANHNIHIYSPGSSNTVKDLLISGNTFYTQAALGAAGSAVMKLGGTITGLKVIGNHIEGANSDGILSDAGTLSGIIQGNEFVNIDGHAISVVTDGNLSISANVFDSGIGKAALYKRGAGNVTFRGNDVWSANASGLTSFDGAAVDVDGADLFLSRDNAIKTADPTYGFVVRSGVALADVNLNLVSGPAVDVFHAATKAAPVVALATSSAGLPSGALWNDGGTVKVVT
jgi:hypothetical protein